MFLRLVSIVLRFLNVVGQEDVECGLLDGIYVLPQYLVVLWIRPYLGLPRW